MSMMLIIGLAAFEGPQKQLNFLRRKFALDRESDTGALHRGVG